MRADSNPGRRGLGYVVVVCVSAASLFPPCPVVVVRSSLHPFQGADPAMKVRLRPAL